MNDHDIATEIEIEQPVRERLPFISALVGLFVIGAVTVSPLEGWSLIVKGMGVVLAISFAVRSLSARVRPTPEVFLFLGWVLWSTLGVFNARSNFLFYTMLGSVAQMWVLLAIVSLFCENRRTTSFLIASFLVGAAIVGGYSFFTGEYKVAEAGGARLAGLVLNANGFGFMMLLATVGMAYFWMLPMRAGWLKHIVLTLGMLVTTISVVLSSSRTTLAGLAAFYFLWVLFCYRKEVFRRPGILVGILLAIVLGFVVYNYFGKGSDVERRFQAGWESFTGEGSTEYSTRERLDNYRTGFRLFGEYPIVGIGLDNFRVHTASGLVAHSEYMEILADTGLPGFLLYFTIFAVLWWRCGRIIKLSHDPLDIKMCRLVRVFILILMLTNVGRWSFNEKGTWIVIAAFIGFSNAAWQKVKHQNYLAGSYSVQATGPVDKYALD